MLRNMNNPFTEPVIRGAILTLEGGYKVRASVTVYPKPRYTQSDYERELVESFNRSQPNMANKVVKCHLMRN